MRLHTLEISHYSRQHHTELPLGRSCQSNPIIHVLYIHGRKPSRAIDGTNKANLFFSLTVVLYLKSSKRKASPFFKCSVFTRLSNETNSRLCAISFSCYTVH